MKSNKQDVFKKSALFKLTEMSIDFGNGFATTNRPDHILQNYNSRNRGTMANVATLAPTENRFTKAYEGMSDLSLDGSQLLHNKTQQIIEAVSKFNQALKEASKNRRVDLTEEEAQHMNPDAIASLSAVFKYTAESNPTVNDMDKE